MKVYDLKDKEGRVFAFEVGNTFLGREKLYRLVEGISGTQILKKPKFLSELREEVFCEFEINSQKFEVWEPFGDNSRYWIGPEPPHWCDQVEIVRKAFVEYKQRFWSR